VGSVSVDKIRVRVGDSLTVTFSIKNIGSAASGTFRYRISLSPSTYGSTYPMAYFYDSLEAGQSKPLTKTATVPSVSEGYYYVTVYVDDDRAIGESNENNNIGSTGAPGGQGQIYVYAGPPTYSYTVSVSGLGGSCRANVYLDGVQRASLSNGQSYMFSELTGTHTISVDSVVNDGSSVRYICSSNTITVSSSGSYTFSYKTQYYMEMNVNPSGSGTVSPRSGWYDAGSPISISASPSPGYKFKSWSASGSITVSSSGSSSATATINGPGSITANFEPTERFDFSISISPPTKTIKAGESTTFSITVSLLSGTAQTVTLSLSGQDNTMSYEFRPSSGSPTFMSTLTISTKSSTPTNTYTLTITGASGAVTKQGQAILVVQPGTPKPTLTFTSLEPSSIETSETTYDANLVATGTNFYNVVEITLSWSGPDSGTITWKKGDSRWNERVIVSSDTKMTLRPRVLYEERGTQQKTWTWTVTLKDNTGATASRQFTVIYKPPPQTSVTAAIDQNLLDLIDRYASSYYKDTWKLTIEQYKAWIATIAWAEGGKGGYVAHSQGSLGSDVFNHWEARTAGSSFRFSTGIGPFQIDRIHYPAWGINAPTMPTIDKLDPEKALMIVLNYHYQKFGAGKSLNDFAQGSDWFAVRDPAAHWNAVTGTSWDFHKNGKAYLDWNRVKSELAKNAASPDYRFENNVQSLGLKKWNIKESDNIKTDSGKKVIFDGLYETWLITSRDWRGTELFKYYYTLNRDEGIEVWVWDNSNDPINKFRYIFVREYSKQLQPEKPEHRSGSVAGETLTSPAIVISDSPPSCSIQLLDKATGSQITQVAVNKAFHIQVIASDDFGITQVRFSSDDSQDGNPTGSWTEWLSWDTSLNHWTGYWDAVGKKKEWTFTTTGNKEVWAEVKDTSGQTKAAKADIYCYSPTPSMNVQPTTWSDSVEAGKSKAQTFTVSASGGTVKGVTVTKISGPDWITVSPTSLGDIPAGSSKTFTITASPPARISGSFSYLIRVACTEGEPRSIDVSGTITVTPPPNRPPYMPSNPSPSDGATNVPTSLTLSWSGGDPDGDRVTYEFYLGTTSTPPLVGSTDVTSTSVTNLKPDTTYYWKVVAEDDKGARTEGPLWRFTTAPAPPPKPDLIVEKVEVRVHEKPAGSNPREGDSIEFIVTIKNVGEAPASPGWYVDYYVDGRPAGRSGPATTSVGPGATAVNEFPWKAPDGSAGKHTFRAVVDPTNVVGEKDEGNNEKSIEFVIEPAVLPDLTISAYMPIEPLVISLEKLPIAPSIIITEKNAGGADAGMHTDRVTITIEGVWRQSLVEERRHSLRAGESSQLPLPELPGLPPPPPGEYKAKITVALDVLNEVKESNEQNNVWEGVITIRVPPVPQLTVVSPNGGETWAVGSTQTIRWKAEGVMGNVRIDLSRDGGSTWTTIIPSTPNDGSESWIVTGPATTQARIRIVSLANPAVWDMSDRPFAITAASITVVSPNGGEVWLIGSTQTIKWEFKTYIITTYVKIDLSRDGGKTWETIIPNTINDGSEPWTVTGPPTEKALIRVTSLQWPEASDTSDGAFTIALKGDMNRNGRLDTGDATIILRKVVGLEPTSPEDALIGDMNGNGFLDSGDATIILRRVVGLE
jgi:VCBS repeat-containing protein